MIQRKYFITCVILLCIGAGLGYRLHKKRHNALPETPVRSWEQSMEHDKDIPAIPARDVADDVYMDFGSRFTKDTFVQKMRAQERYDTQKEKIAYLSALFLDTPYKGHTLSDPDETERLIVDFSGVDCFTYLDYVFAMVDATDIVSFVDHVQAVRYDQGVIAYARRNHFFTDWIARNDFVNVAPDIAPDTHVVAHKTLNQKSTGETVLDTPVRTVDVAYIPTRHLDENILQKLETGDVVGFYAHQKWLDVSHVGIIIRADDGTLLLRHASSQKKRVVDMAFVPYARQYDGIVVLRQSAVTQ